MVARYNSATITTVPSFPLSMLSRTKVRKKTKSVKVLHLTYQCDDIEQIPPTLVYHTINSMALSTVIHFNKSLTSYNQQYYCPYTTSVQTNFRYWQTTLNPSSQTYYTNVTYHRSPIHGLYFKTHFSKVWTSMWH